MSAPRVEHRRERILPSGCAHIVLTLSRDFLTDCLEGGSEQRTAPVLIVGQRSVYEIIATSDLVELAGVLFAPGALPALVADRADLPARWRPQLVLGYSVMSALIDGWYKPNGRSFLRT